MRQERKDDAEKTMQAAYLLVRRSSQHYQELVLSENSMNKHDQFSLLSPAPSLQRFPTASLNSYVNAPRCCYTWHITKSY